MLAPVRFGVVLLLAGAMMAVAWFFAEPMPTQERTHPHTRTPPQTDGLSFEETSALSSKNETTTASHTIPYDYDTAHSTSGEE